VAKEKVNEKIADVKIKYAPEIKLAKIKYDETKLRVKGYTLPKFDDKSELHMVTDFERKLPIAKMDLDDFERRLKKLGDKDNKDLISKY
jgi:hypothetical protein